MKKQLIAFSLGSILLIPGFALANTYQAGPVFCPGTSQIVVGNIYNGQAHSADGKWQGASAIPPQDESDWRTKSMSVNYTYLGGGVCQYFLNSTGTKVIDLFNPELRGYAIYEGTDPDASANCWDWGTYEQTPTKPHGNQACYFSKKPI